MVEVPCGVPGCTNTVFAKATACDDCIAKAQYLTAPPMHPTAALLALQGYQLCKYKPKNPTAGDGSARNVYRIRRTLNGKGVQLAIRQATNGDHIFTTWAAGKSGHDNDYLPARWDELPPAVYDVLTRTPLDALALAEESSDDA